MSKNQAEIEFIERVQESQGIIHKVSRMYCDNEEHRKDLFQEILIHLWKSFPSFKGNSKFSTWMYRVALNVALQDMRNIKKERGLFSADATIMDIPEDQSSNEKEELLHLMYQSLSVLTKVEKAIIMLHLEEKSNEEIAEIVGITQNYVRVRMTRIREKLQKTLNPSP